MSYTPTTWHGGDVLSAEAMNKIENGIANAGSGALEVERISDGDGGYVLDKTWQEIYDAFPNVYIIDNNYDYYKLAITDIMEDDGSYGLYALYDYSTDSPSGYPSTGGIK